MFKLRDLTLTLLIIAMTSKASQELNNETDLDTTGYKVVKFYAEWCGPCRSFKPDFEKVAKDHKDKAEFFSANLDNYNDLATKYKVTSIPSIVILKDGKLVEKMGGSETQLRAKLESLKPTTEEVVEVVPVVEIKKTEKVEKKVKTVKRSADKLNEVETKEVKKSCKS